MSRFARWVAGVLITPFTAAVLAADFAPPVIRSYPHDPSAFTQGLVWDRGLLYESTGRYGHSTLSVREPATGRVLRRHELPKAVFGEGIALVGDEIIQLTWQEHQAFVYDKASLRLKRTLPYAWEGWGLTYDGRHLIASDGSAQLRFLDPATLREVRRLDVTDGGQAIDQLNELECVKGEILANRYGFDRIARISPQTGQVIAWIELSHLYPAQQRPSYEAVLNGIAYDAARDVLIVTGKHWPKLFELPAP
ncbi:MAG: glutaminyl-peptide cyclotransferase [Hydrogenophilales bacterium]|nr:glutaminyl-peptide cyclotransferase [Hydrogenophilales bacterium]